MNLIELFLAVKNHFSPKIVEEVNDQYIKIVKINGEKVSWYKHEKRK